MPPSFAAEYNILKGKRDALPAQTLCHGLSGHNGGIRSGRYRAVGPGQLQNAAFGDDRQKLHADGVDALVQISHGSVFAEALAPDAVHHQAHGALRAATRQQPVRHDLAVAQGHGSGVSTSRALSATVEAAVNGAPMPAAVSSRIKSK